MFGTEKNEFDVFILFPTDLTDKKTRILFGGNFKTKNPEIAPSVSYPGSVTVSSDSPDFWLLSVAALLENSDPQGAADVAQVIYNRVASPAWPKDIRSVILQGNGGKKRY
jgi:hypothetical protein